MTRILGIVGASHSGAGALTALLGSLPRSFPAGAVHWLHGSSAVLCPDCGSRCTAWTAETRGRLHGAADRAQALRESFPHHDWVVVADQDPAFYRDAGRVDHWVLQWRDPRGWYASVRRREGATIEQAIAAWTGRYDDAFALLESRDNVSYLDWDVCARHPDLYLRHLLDDLGIVRPPGFAFSPNGLHMIRGGPSAAPTRVDDATGQDDRRQWPLSEDESRQIIDHPDVARIVERLSHLFFEAGGRHRSIDRLPAVLWPASIASNLDSIRHGQAFAYDHSRHQLVGIFEVAALSDGPRIKLFTSNDCIITRLLSLKGPGAFEHMAMTLWTRMVARSQTALDVGAFTGIYSLQAAAANPAIRVIAFEPNALAYARLLTNLKLNGQITRVAPVQAGLADIDGILPLRHPFGFYALTSGESFIPEHFPGALSETEARVLRFDDLIADGKRLGSVLPIALEVGTPPFVMKMDVEGCEDRALAGMRQFLLSGRPRILIEILDPWAYPGVRSALDGYRIAYIDEQAFRLVEADGAFVSRGNYIALHESDRDEIERLTGEFGDGLGPAQPP